MDNHVIVSVCVVTYNSSEYIEQTLESIKAQSYSEIELIISDDCSKDDTVNVCREWIEANKTRFITSRVIVLPKNSGVSANCNNAVKNSNGDWIILLGGDDMLTPNAVHDYLDYTNSNKNAEIIFSSYQCFIYRQGKISLGTVRPSNREIEILTKNNPDAQLECLLYENYLPAPSYIISKELATKYSFEEKYRFFEDYPYWLKLSISGTLFYYMPKVTVLYRQHESSSHSNEKYVNENLLLDNERCFFETIFPRFRNNSDLIKYKRATFFIREFEVMLLNNNRNNILGRIILKYVRRVLSRWACRAITY